MKIKYQLELLVVDNKTNKFTKPCNWTTKQISNKSRTLWLWFLHFIFSLSCQHKQEYSTSINWLIKSFFRLQNCMIFCSFILSSTVNVVKFHTTLDDGSMSHQSCQMIYKWSKNVVAHADGAVFRSYFTISLCW